MPTKIEWVINQDGTMGISWNPVTGCTPVSEGCQRCYAKRMSIRLAGRFGYPKNNPFEVTLRPERLNDPLKWSKPRRVFVCSMSDIFHENVPEIWILTVFAIMAETPQHTYMIITKRPHRMNKVLTSPTVANDVWLQTGRGVNAEPSLWPLRNVWLGVTAENQARADERIPILLKTPAVLRFVSVEPMLGPVDMTNVRVPPDQDRLNRLGIFPSKFNALTTEDEDHYYQPPSKIDWVIAGGETGPGARPMHPDWVRDLRNQCQDWGTPFFFKSWGDWGPQPTRDVPVIGCSDSGRFHYGPNPSMGWAMYRVGKKAAGRVLDGRVWNEMPEAIKQAPDGGK